MIAESYYWREELLKIANNIKEKHQIIEWTDSDNAEFEKEIMIGFYIIRKLIEANKLTNRIIATNIKGHKFQSVGKQITFMNNHRFPELYDLQNKLKNKFDLRFLINQFVHSYIFYPVIDFTDPEFRNSISESISDEEYDELYQKAEKKIVSIYFNSDDNKDKFLYEIDIKKITGLFEEVGKCDITSMSLVYNSKKKDYDISLSNELQEIPDEIKKMIEKHEEEDNTP